MINIQNHAELIEKGEMLKKRINALIKNTCSQYFQSVIKKSDTITLKIQRTISYLSLKGVPISYIVSENKNIGFSNIKLFIPKEKIKMDFKIEKIFNVLYAKLSNKTPEIEVIVKNLTINRYDNLYVKVLYIHDFFEQVVLYEKIDYWLPQEELVFILPAISNEHEYMFYIMNESDKKILHQKIIKPE